MLFSGKLKLISFGLISTFGLIAGLFISILESILGK